MTGSVAEFMAIPWAPLISQVYRPEEIQKLKARRSSRVDAAFVKEHPQDRDRSTALDR